MEVANSAAAIIPCGACIQLGWSCSPYCVFATCFPRNRPNKFAIIQRAFGTGPVWNWLALCPPEHRMFASEVLACEASYRLRWWARNHPDNAFPPGEGTLIHHNISEEEVQMRMGLAAEATIVTVTPCFNQFPTHESYSVNPYGYGYYW